MALAHEKGFQSIAFPLIGAGSGGFNQQRAQAIMEDELAKMSDGVFNPTDIEEVWEDEEGPISVHFALEGQRYTLCPTWGNDRLDVDVLASINRVIGRSGKEFVCASDVNFAVVFVLDGECKKRLSAERRFPFITLGTPPVAARQQRSPDVRLIMTMPLASSKSQSFIEERAIP